MKTKSKHDPKKVPDWMVHPWPGESFDEVVDYQEYVLKRKEYAIRIDASFSGIVIEVKGTEIVDSSR